MFTEFDDAVYAVETLNTTLQTLVPKSILDLSLTFSSIGQEASVIKFLGIIIWNSNEDEREFFANKNEYESLQLFLLKQINKIFKEFEKISPIVIPVMNHQINFKELEKVDKPVKQTSRPAAYPDHWYMSPNEPYKEE